MAIRKYFFLLLIFFIMALIAVPRLAWDGLWYDEVFSVINSLGAPFGEPSLTGIWEQVSQRDPHQALGYPYLLAVWGQFIAWTEFALRAFSLMAALLALAFTYQLGKRLVSEQTGILSALVLALSTFFIQYTHELRSFTLVAAGAAAFVLAYFHLLHSQKKQILPYQFLFVLSASIMLWSHYYSAMLIVAVGVYHLIFVKKDRRWLEITGLAILIGVLFLPQLPSFIEGYTRFETGDLAIPPLTTTEALERLLYFIGNDFALLTIVSMLAALYLAWKQVPKLRLLLGISILSTGVLLLSNILLGILEPSRLRYAIFLFPLLAVWNGAGLAYLAEKLRDVFRPVFPKHFERIAPILLLLLPLLWLINGICANYETGFSESIEGDEIPRMRLIINAIASGESSSDLIVFYNGSNAQAWGFQHTMEYSFNALLPNWLFASTFFDEVTESNRVWAQEQLAQAQRLWYGVNRRLPLREIHQQFLDLLEEDFVHCNNLVDEDDIALNLYARSTAFCLTDETIMQFGDWFSLEAYETSIDDNTAMLNLAWQLETNSPAENYSLAVHLVSREETQPIVQADIAFMNEAIILMPISLDISTLPTGNYEIWLTVYNWQTGDRLQTSEGDFRWRIFSFER